MANERQVPFSVLSVYSQTPQIQLLDPQTGELTNRFIWGRWEALEFPPSNTDEFVVVTGPLLGRLDLVSSQQYDSPHLWRVLAIANNIFDPFAVDREEGMYIGQRLRIPQRDRVIAILLRGKEVRSRVQSAGTLDVENR